MIKIKMCGITNSDDARAAVHSGAWALGFVFYKKSPRYISPSRAKKIIAALPPFVVPVGVFVNQKEGALKDIASFCGLSTLQLHGDETPQYCGRLKDYKVIKAFRVGAGFEAATARRYAVSAYLFDTYQEDAFGGSGKAFNWGLIQGEKFDAPVILSGGLHAGNVAEAISAVGPYAVDVSSGVESAPGKKDVVLLQAFCKAVRTAVEKGNSAGAREDV